MKSVRPIVFVLICDLLRTKTEDQYCLLWRFILVAELLENLVEAYDSR